MYAQSQEKVADFQEKFRHFAPCEKRLCRNNLFPEVSLAAHEQRNLSGRQYGAKLSRPRTIGRNEGTGNLFICSPRHGRGNGDGCCLSRGKVADRYAVGQPLIDGKAERGFSGKRRVHNAALRLVLALSCPFLALPKDLPIRNRKAARIASDGFPV